MSYTVHIEGMGVQGCLLAQLLFDRGQPFTWSDKEVEHTAWKACTGAIYPSGSEKFGPDMRCRKVWAYWHASGRFDPFTERAVFMFCSKNPPHEGRYKHFEMAGTPLRLGAEESYHFNAQGFVEGARSIFWREQREEMPADADVRIIAHGFGERMSHAYWGWTALVRLSFPGDWDLQYRPAIYLRKGRYIMAYAYPVPNTEFWYAGSSIIKQRKDKLKRLDVDKHFKRWEENFTDLCGGAVLVHTIDDMFQGWRPACGDAEWVQDYNLNGDRILSLRPLWNSGVRHFPHQWQQVAEKLGIRLPAEELVY